MKKALAAAVLVLLVLAVLAAVLLPRLANVEQYRGRIESTLRERTGWNVTLGAIDLSLLHGPAVRIRPVTARDPVSRSTLEVTELAARAELLPLLHGHLVVRRIDVLGPRITLPRTPAGLSLPALPTASQPAGKAGAAAGTPTRFDVQVQEIRVRDGAITISGGEGGKAPWTLSDISTDLDPATGNLRGSAALPENGGRIGWSGTLGGALTLDLDAVRSAALPPWATGDLVRPGASLSGTVQVTGGDRIESKLSARNVAFLAGETPLENLSASFTVTRSGDRWTLERLDLGIAGAAVTGSGRLLPTLSLSLKIPEAPIGDALRLARATFPLPLDIEGPGVFAADIGLRRDARGDLLTTGSGTLTAARVRLAPNLPPLDKVRTDFRLKRDGTLDADPIEGTLAGGALRLRARVAPIAPPGSLSLSGTLGGARLPALLSGLGEAAAKLSGTADAAIALTADLGRSTVDASALGGTIEVAASRLELPGWDLVQALDQQLASSSSVTEGLAEMALKRLGGAKEPKGTTVAGTGTFERASASLDLARIPWRLTGVSLVSKELSAAGAGTFDPLTGAVDLELSARLGPGLSKRLLEQLPPLRNLRDAEGRLVLPLRVSGSGASPSISCDLRRALIGNLQPKDSDGDRTKLIKGLMDSLLKKKKD